MAWDKAHKKKTREKILQSGAKLFMLRGFEKVGINDVMADAGLTRGAFYSHFASKADLYAEALRTAGKRRARQVTGMPVAARQQALDKLVNAYLSEGHRNSQDGGCPLAFLVSDISQQDEQVRGVYTDVFKGFTRLLAGRSETPADLDSMDAGERRLLLQKTVMMIGGLAVARALNDDQLAAELLSACREGALNTV